jgi:putative two-component system response regulator
MSHYLSAVDESARSGLAVLPEAGGREERALDRTEEILFALALAVEQRDTVTAGHCQRLALTALVLGKAMALDRASLLVLYRGGYLHDIGKVGIPDSILFKPGRLTAQEWGIMRSHPIRGEEICRPLQSLAGVLPLIRHHHERWDGSGYPDGLRGTQIPLLARVLQVGDIYDALTNPRPYKRAYAPKQAFRILDQETARGWRDPELMKLFFQVHDEVLARIAELTSRPDSVWGGMPVTLRHLNQILDSGAPVVAAGLRL